MPDIGAFECCGADRTRRPTFVPPAPPQGDDDDQGEDEDGDGPAETTTAARSSPPVPAPAPCSARRSSSPPARARCSSAAPAQKRFRELGAAMLLPSGTVVDARRGRIRLTTALDEAGEFQTGRFWGSRFQIRQGHEAAGMTSLTLRGGDFGRCPARASGLAHASGVARENPTTRRVVRSLWARDRGGRFRTYGNNSVATARGTAWVTPRPLRRHGHARERGRGRRQGPPHGQDRRRPRRPRATSRSDEVAAAACRGCGCC